MFRMRKLTAAAALVIAVLVCLPGAALASSTSLRSAAATEGTGVGLPLSSPKSLTTRPPGFSADAAQAMHSAEASPTMIALHARKHPLEVLPLVWAGRNWYVDFSYRGVRVAEVVETTGARLPSLSTRAATSRRCSARRGCSCPSRSSSSSPSSTRGGRGGCSTWTRS